MLMVVAAQETKRRVCACVEEEGGAQPARARVCDFECAHRLCMHSACARMNIVCVSERGQGEVCEYVSWS